MSLTSGRLYLKYGFATLPTLADRNAESGVGNWTNVGNHTITAPTDHVHTGTKSFKIFATDAGDFTSNYVSLPALNSQTLVVGVQSAITLWTLQAAGSPINFQMLSNGIGSGSSFSTIVDGLWHPLTWVFTVVTANTQIQICLSGAATVYFDDITVSKCVYFDVMSEKGLTDPDDYDFWPPNMQKNTLSGGIREQWTSYRRKPTFDIGVVPAHSDRLGVLDWGMDTARQIDYETEAQLPMALKSAAGFQWQWLNNISIGRQATLEMMEPEVRTGAFPV